MSHLERYKKLEELDLNEAISKLRMHIGELPQQRLPDQTEVEEAIEELFPELLTHEKSALCEKFLNDEADTEALADQKAEE